MTTGPARALLRRLGQYLDGFSAYFSRQPQREAASQCLDGLLNDSERKSMRARHGRLSDPGQYQALQHFITHSPWDDAGLRRSRSTGDRITLIHCPLKDGRTGGAIGFVVTSDGTWYNPADGGCRANEMNWRTWIEAGYTSRAQAEAAGKKIT